MNAEVVEGRTLAYVLVKPDGFTPDGSFPLIILLHGFGASMYDLASVAGALNPTGYVYAFPNGPYEVDLGMYGSGYSWSADRPGVVPIENDNMTIDEKLDVCFAEILEATGAAPGNIVLGGFSQGAGVTLRYGLLRPGSFAGLVVLSGFFRDAGTVRELLPVERTQPIFMVHGRQDPMIALESARETRAFLEDNGYSPEYHEYDMPHTISEEVLKDLAPWLTKTLPPRAS
ncbi:MAG TPA: alpha/beta fold hydrolase [Dehalococcoidia bacterium]|nr:alpha/beta fold hydrolase [Dehalococcoidia bacterium]